jgi:hypothetical protein
MKSEQLNVEQIEERNFIVIERAVEGFSWFFVRRGSLTFVFTDQNAGTFDLSKILELEENLPVIHIESGEQ